VLARRRQLLARVALAGVAAAALALGLASWRARAPAAPDLGAPDAETRRMLEALGYSAWADSASGEGEGGVLRLDAARAAPGASLYSSTTRASAQLVDLDGRVLRRWQDPAPRAKGWDHVELGPDGALFAIDGNGVLQKWSADGQLLWRVDIAAHHDLAVADDGRVLVLVQARRDLGSVTPPLPIVDNAIVTLAPDGTRLGEVWLGDVLGPLLSEKRRAEVARHQRERDPEDWDPQALDVFHANSLAILPRDLPGVGARGDVLVSVRGLDLLAVLALDPLRLVWSWGPGELELQHDASILPDGHFLVFDNGRRRRWSRVLELDPAAGRIVWEYGSAPEQRFFSAKRGGSQKLQNGNVLITDSESARAFEVTPEGDVVWEFLNPEREGEKRAAIYRMTRHAAPPGTARAAP
jgi:outer membrane protein assembly factor BamB